MNYIANPEKIPQRQLFDGTKIPGVGLGTFSSDKYSSEQVSQAVYGAIHAGYRLVDCASVYQNESNIGEVFHRVINDCIVARDELFVISKVWNDMHGDVQKSCLESLNNLKLDYIDLFFIHWPFPNYHVPGCDRNFRNPDSKAFDLNEFMSVWRQCEQLVDLGLVKYIGMSNMTVPKMEAVLPLCKIKPAALEMELHPSFQQPELFDYAIAHNIVPIGYCPLGSPSRPERDRTEEDVSDIQMPVIMEIAKAHGVHPAIVCLKWAAQRGQIPIPFSIKESQYIDNLQCIVQDPLSSEEMMKIKNSDMNCRLIKGQVFLWNGAKSWEDLWDLNGIITK